ncbi:MAG TPA: hypothetical protein VMX17_00650 [Candidatus Glassbacteria bacterium]|nr:hypothetical protein [Candidatus Glassbacteria bacterium]
MVSECDLCIHRDTCAPVEKTIDNSGSMCDGFIDMNFYVDDEDGCNTYEFRIETMGGSEEVYWREMSFRKYDSIDRKQI